MPLHHYQRLLGSHEKAVSMGGNGDCHDNAVMGRFFSTLKAECVARVYPSRARRSSSTSRCGTIDIAATHLSVTKAMSRSRRDI
jgi:transposase InsO family protein